MSNVLTKDLEDRVQVNQTRLTTCFRTHAPTNDPSRWPMTSGGELNWRFNAETTSKFLRHREDEMGEPRKPAPRGFAEK